MYKKLDDDNIEDESGTFRGKWKQANFQEPGSKLELI